MRKLLSRKALWLPLASVLIVCAGVFVYFGTRDTRDIRYSYNHESRSITFIANRGSEITSVDLKYGAIMTISNEHEAEYSIASFGQEYITVHYTNRKGEPNANIFDITASQTTRTVFIYQYDLSTALIDFSSFPYTP